MKILIFDTETTGLPKSKYINPTTLNEWPHIVQFSSLVYDTNKNDIINLQNDIVNFDENIIIPEESSKIHGITNEIASDSGIDIQTIFGKFFDNLSKVDMLVGHNIEFDINIIKVELLRLIHKNNGNNQHNVNKFKEQLNSICKYKHIHCTMRENINFCGIEQISKQGKPYFKFPKLVQLHEKIFNATPKNLHNSLNDILVTLRCYVYLNHNIDLLETCELFKLYSERNKIY
jgi:DNA polymerase III epsilon subunit-like protein